MTQWQLRYRDRYYGWIRVMFYTARSRDEARDWFWREHAAGADEYELLDVTAVS